MAVESNALCSLDEVKNYIGMVGSKQVDDDLLEDLSNRVTQLFTNFCERDTFKVKTYTEYYDGDASRHLFVNNTPLISITSIYDDPDWVWGSDTLLVASTYRIVDGKYVTLNGEAFSSYDQSIKIVYRAGYETIPLDLKQAAIEEVVRKYKHRKDFDVLSKTLDDGTADYIGPELMKSTLQVLKFYRVNWVY